MLEITIFLCGALVMILEMTGARVLAPHVGTSAIVWTSLIGIVLAFLSVGSWLGGRFADKKLSRQGLAFILAAAGMGCMAPAFFHTAIGNGITQQIHNLYISAVLSAICIFAVPATFFGMLSPYIIRLRIANLNTAGSTVGRLYALSTAGSILGTFLGGFFLISWFSSTTILWSVAVGMFILSIINFKQKPWLRLVLLAICIFLAYQDKAFAELQIKKGGARLIESPYNSIRIMKGIDYTKNGSEVVLMATDPGYSQSGMTLKDPDELYFNYTRFYALGPALKPEAKKILMLGGGGYSVPKWLLSGKSRLKSGKPEKLSVVEIDPAMTKAAKDFFALAEDPALEIIHEDARAFLNRQKNKYDIIFMDVFNSHYSIPFQMGTKEAVMQLKNALAPDGIALINIISAVTGKDGRLFRSIYKNLEEIFPSVDVYCVGEPENPERIQNLMVVAQNQASKLNLSTDSGPNAANNSPSIKEIMKMENNRYKGDIPDDVPALTDDFAPVERYTLMLARDNN